MFAAALLNQGVSLRNASAIAGISINGAIALKRWGKQHKTRLEGITAVFKDKHKLVADLAVSAITQKKLETSSAVDCMRVSKEAGIIAGITICYFSAQSRVCVQLAEALACAAQSRMLPKSDALPRKVTDCYPRIAW